MDITPKDLIDLAVQHEKSGGRDCTAKILRAAAEELSFFEVQGDELEKWIVFYFHEHSQNWYSQGPLHDTPHQAAEWFKKSPYFEGTPEWLAIRVVVPQLDRSTPNL